MILKEDITFIGIIIDINPFKEKDAMVKIVTETENATLIVKNAYSLKSRFKEMLFVGNIVSVRCKNIDEDLFLLLESSLIFDISECYSDLKKMSFLLFLQECYKSFLLVDQTLNFKSLKMIVSSINTSDILSLALLFLGQLYIALGLKINTESCISCSRKDHIVSLSLIDGGFICKDCLSKYKYALDVEDIELHIYRFAFKEIDDKALNRCVPKEEGIKVFKSLLSHLCSYFDIKDLKSTLLMIKQL